MSDERNLSTPRSGEVTSTPEGGPVGEGAPASVPGAGQVQSTPEAAPLGEPESMSPPTWRDQMRGPILGLEGEPPRAGQTPSAEPAPTPTRTPEPAGKEKPSPGLKKWPPYTGKPVSEVRWQEAARYAAPIAIQVEKVAIQTIDLSARGLSRLARYLEARRQRREQDQD
jgi:hypothetical protein